MEREKKRYKIPVEVDDEHGFSVDERRLDESLHRRIDELAEQKVAEKQTGLRLFLASVLGLFVMGCIAMLTMRGAVIMPFLLIIAVIFNASGIAKWIEGNGK